MLPLESPQRHLAVRATTVPRIPKFCFSQIPHNGIFGTAKKGCGLIKRAVELRQFLKLIQVNFRLWTPGKTSNLLFFHFFFHHGFSLDTLPGHHTALGARAADRSDRRIFKDICGTWTNCGADHLPGRNALRGYRDSARLTDQSSGGGAILHRTASPLKYSTGSSTKIQFCTPSRV